MYLEPGRQSSKRENSETWTGGAVLQQSKGLWEEIVVWSLGGEGSLMRDKSM